MILNEAVCYRRAIDAVPLVSQQAAAAHDPKSSIFSRHIGIPVEIEETEINVRDGLSGSCVMG